MTRVEFCEKHGEYLSVEMLKTTDVLMRVVSNLSDTQELINRDMDAIGQLNMIKEYIFDFMSVLRHEEKLKKYEEQEMNEFNNHLGKF